VFAALVSAVVSAHAVEEPYEAYLRVANQVAEGDRLYFSKPIEALQQYLRAQQTLRTLRANHPTWNAKVVDGKLKYLSERVPPMMQQLGIPGTAVTPQGAPAAVPAVPTVGVAQLNRRIEALRNEKLELQHELAKIETEYTEKLREALKVRPRELEPGELAKAETANSKLREQMVYLESHYQKLDSEYKKVQAEMTRLEKNLATTKKENNKLRAQVDGKRLKELAEENARLRRQAAQRDGLVKSLQEQIRKLERLLLNAP